VRAGAAVERAGGPIDVKTRIDVASVVGIVLAAGALLVGQLLEGGSLASLAQATAGVIVFGGTAGATLLSVSWSDAVRALRMLRSVFAPEPVSADALIERLSSLATVARRDGIIALDARVRDVPDRFLRRAVRYIVDGTSTQHLREILETDAHVRCEEGRRAVRVFETAGGYAPTIGILGAVLGLIHAMEHLSEPARLGDGIAVAFVATVYGVGLANLVLHPVASKLEQHVEERYRLDEMVLEGALALQTGAHPAAVRQRLHAYLGESGRGVRP